MALPHLQVVLPVVPGLPLVAGVPALLRLAHTLVDDRAERVVLVGDTVGPFAEVWHRQLRTLPFSLVSSTAGPLTTGLDWDSPALTLAPEGVPQTDALRSFVETARQRPGPTAWIWSGRTVALYYPQARALFDILARSPRRGVTRFFSGASHGIVASAASWYDLQDPKAVQQAEADLFRSLTKDTDGYLAPLRPADLRRALSGPDPHSRHPERRHRGEPGRRAHRCGAPRRSQRFHHVRGSGAAVDDVHPRRQ